MADYLKLHVDALDNPKIQKLPDQLVKPWLNLLILTRLSGGFLPDLKAIAFRLRTDQATAAGWIAQLQKAGLIDSIGAGGELQPHDWEFWQPSQAADRTNAERQRRFREKRRNAVTVSPEPPSKEIQEENIQPTKGVTPLRNDSLRNALRNGRNAVTVGGLDEWLKTCVQVRSKFPASSDLEVSAIIESCLQWCISEEIAPEDCPDDDDLAEAVRLSHFDGQGNVRAYRSRAKEVLNTWFQRRKHDEQMAKTGSRPKS